MFIKSKSIDLYDQNMDMACAKVNSDVQAYYWNWFFLSKFGYGMCQS